jgi:hypothetical protein
MRLDYSGTKIIQIFIVTNRFILDHAVSSSILAHLEKPTTFNESVIEDVKHGMEENPKKCYFLRLFHWNT